MDPPQGQRQILYPEGWEGSVEIPQITSLNSPDLALEQDFIPGVHREKRNLKWNEKNRVARDLLREKAQGLAQLLTKITVLPPSIHHLQALDPHPKPQVRRGFQNRQLNN